MTDHNNRANNYVMRLAFSKISAAVLLLANIATVSFSMEVCPEPYDSNTWSDCFGKLTFLQGMTFPSKAGDFYEGEWLNGKPHGEGKFTTKDGTFYYHGSFENGEFHGYGISGGENGTYAGEWKED